MKNKIKKIRDKIVPIIAVIVIICLSVSLVVYYECGTQKTVTITVTDKAVKCYNNSDKYIVYTENETFEITDNLFVLRFNSSDDYGKLKVGETYTVTVNGWRVPFLSLYRNIIEINE